MAGLCCPCPPLLVLVLVVREALAAHEHVHGLAELARHVVPGLRVAPGRLVRRAVDGCGAEALTRHVDHRLALGISFTVPASHLLPPPAYTRPVSRRSYRPSSVSTPLSPP